MLNIYFGKNEMTENCRHFYSRRQRKCFLNLLRHFNTVIRIGKLSCLAFLLIMSMKHELQAYIEIEERTEMT
jgi:hypothetical protein